ncbi:MAG: flagellar basal body L-ring protein FlgH, partial [Steroidobacteraceae bacterium]
MFNRIQRPLLVPIAAALVTLLLTFSQGCVHAPHVENYDATLPEEAPPAQASNGSIYQVGHDVALFENPVARHVGDIVTVRLVESTAAQKSS